MKGRKRRDASSLVRSGVPVRHARRYWAPLLGLLGESARRGRFSERRISQQLDTFTLEVSVITLALLGLILARLCLGPVRLRLQLSA